VGNWEFKQLLSAERATAFRQSGEPETADKVLRVRWQVPIGAVNDCLVHLDTYANTASDTPSYSVTNPKFGNETFSGTWRLASSRADVAGRSDTAPSIVEAVYVLGYATALDQNEARLVSWKSSTVDPHKSASEILIRFVRRFPHIKPESAYGLAAANDSGTSTSPRASRETWSGTYTIAGAEVGRDQQGALFIDQTLELVASIPDYSDKTTLASLDTLWIALGYSREPLVPNTTLRRVLLAVPAASAEAYVDLLNAQTSINAPKASGRTFTGLYRNTLALMRESETQLTDTLFVVENKLTLGWETEVLPTGIRVEYNKIRTTPFDATDVVQNTDEVIWYKGIAPDKVDELSPATGAVEGKTYRIVRTISRKEDDGSASIFEHRRTLDVTAQTIESGPGGENTGTILAKTFPTFNAEGLDIQYYDVPIAGADAARGTLEAPPEGYRVERVQVDPDRTGGTANVRQSIERVYGFPEAIAGSGDSVSFSASGFDAEAIEVTWRRIKREDLSAALTALKNEPSLAGYAVIRAFHNDAGVGAADITQQLRKIGTTNTTVEFSDEGRDGEQRVVIYPSRSRASFSDPAAPSGYAELSKVTRSPEAPLSDFVFTYVKIGTVDHTLGTDFGGQDSERQEHVLKNRTSEPAFSPPSGFVLASKQGPTPFAKVSDWIYSVLKTGTAAHQVSIDSPNTPSEAVRVVYRTQEQDPSKAPAPFFLNLETAGYALASKGNTGSGRGFDDWTFDYVKITSSGTLVRTAVLPGFFKREVHEIIGIRDTDLNAKLTELEIDENPRIMVVSVTSTYRGVGYGNVIRTILYLPADPVVEQSDNVERTTQWLHPSAKNVFQRRYAYNDILGNAQAVDGWDTTVSAYTYVGFSLRAIRQTITTTYTKAEPSIADPSGTFFDYTYEAKEQNRDVGYWVKTSVRTVIPGTAAIGGWGASL